MLKSLAISNYALIEKLEVSFPDGLIIITGETGAGKSILLGAISLLLGAKANKEILKDPNQNCVVEALFTIEKSIETESLFIENLMESTTELLIRRVISTTGRARSFVNDQPVNAKFLKDISEKLIDIHAQHEHLLIGKSNFRLQVLDSYAKNREIKESYKYAYNNHKELEKKKRDLEKKLLEEEEDFDYNSFRYKQIEDAALVLGELEEIEEEYKILSNAQEIKSTLYKIMQLINPTEISIVQTLQEIETLFAKISDSIHVTKEMAQRVESCRIELKELERETSQLVESVNFDPSKTTLLEERLSVIYNLLNKYKVNSVEELILIKEKFASKLNLTEEFHEKLKETEKEVLISSNNLIEKAKLLTESREKASDNFSKEMTQKIRELEMPFAQFNTQIKEQEQYDINGKESIEFFFSANKEIAPREISKVASGGELSRIMLCLKAIMARDIQMPSLIFDEIDSGVSGSIADKMGLLIGELSNNLQLFAITHLPQIASKGDCHLLVYKEEGETGAAASKIKRIDGQERVMEIARMLSGSELTPAAIANAKEFLSN
ncbi:MAG: DNA repair protein RecN [Bacteroidales bacterium]